jgi:hypothetical protein
MPDDANDRSEIPGPLDDVNEAFHAGYGHARVARESQSPVFVVLPDLLVLYRGEDRREAHYTPLSFHLLKAAAHTPIGLYALLLEPEGAPDPRIAALRRKIHDSLAAPLYAGAFSDEPEALADLRHTLERSLRFIDASVRNPDAFAAEIGPLLHRLIDHATRIELAALHASVEDFLTVLSADERHALQVVVTGDHQARARNLRMQYFQTRFGEPAGAEIRVAYAEGVTDEREARALVGSRRLDAAIARAFFGDEKRLQRDVLGDAVRDRLLAAKLPALT